MDYSVKFLSLQKTELEYEVAIRGETPGSTVQELRKQITKLGPLFPSEDILISSIPVSEDLMGVNSCLGKIKVALDDENVEKGVLLRTRNLLNHLYHRLNRIEYTDNETKELYTSFVGKFKLYCEKYNNIKDNFVDNLDPQNNESSSTSPPFNITVSCDRGSSGEICKLKYDGKTCVRTFIQRVTEFCQARNTDSSKILAFGTEIFTGDALHWFRSVRDSVKNWEELVHLLKKDFDKSDYDYRLLSEIRSRTQGETENITTYLSIMSGMFSRLTKTLTEEDKLEIITHNIRPCYTGTLAAVPEVKDIDSLRTICRHFENIQARQAHFQEPPKPSAEMLAPEFAYSGSTNKNKNYQTYTKTTNNNQNTFQNKQNYGYNNYNSKNNRYNNNNNYTNRNLNYKNLDAINTEDVRKRFCPRCRVNSHNLRQCTASKAEIYCFVCGRKDVKTPQCPDCSKNRPSGSKN